MPADVLTTFATRQIGRGCGIVTVRERPSAANGLVFLSWEDETGTVKVIVWPSVMETYRREVLMASLLGVYGQ